MRVTLKLVVVASSPCTDTCFVSPVMRILFNGILQISLKQHFAYPSCLCQNLSSGSMSGLNRMFLSSTVSWCLLAKRRNPFLFVAAISLANLFLQNLPPSRVPWPHSVETLTLLVPKTLQRNLWQRLELVSGRSPLWLTVDDAQADSLLPSSCIPFAHKSFLFFVLFLLLVWIMRRMLSQKDEICAWAKRLGCQFLWVSGECATTHSGFCAVFR